MPCGSSGPHPGKIAREVTWPKRLEILLDQLGPCSVAGLHGWRKAQLRTKKPGPIMSHESKLNNFQALLDMLRDPGSAWHFEPAGHWAEVSGLRDKDEICWLIVGKTHRKVRSPLLLGLSLHSVLPLLFQCC